MAMAWCVPCSLSSRFRSNVPRCSAFDKPHESPTFSLPPLSMEPVSLSTSSRPLPNPSLQFSNVLRLNKGCNAEIAVGENEPADAVVRRFRKAVLQEGIISESKRRLHFETTQEEKKRKRLAAQRKRSRKRRFFSFQKKDTSPVTPAKAKDDDDDDYWGPIEDAA